MVLFALFTALAAYGRGKNWSSQRLSAIGGVIVIGIVLALPTVLRTYRSDQAALATTNSRNLLVAQVIKHHPVTTLVGDYWRVVPTKLVSHNSLNVTPLSSCTQMRNILSSQAWQPDLNTHSFAYLLSLDGSLTDYPSCSLNQVVSNYGRPNASVVVAGNITKPKELLLFYDHGAHKPTPKQSSAATAPSSVVPINLDQVANTSCSESTVMNIVAHEDGDLLFMSPDLLHSLKAGDCVRSIYVTAGDAGYGGFYWLSREQGAEAAYSAMLGSSAIWIQRIVNLGDHEFVTIANPKGNANVSLIFMHLPDGNLKGQGFSTTHYESLERLETGKLTTIHAVDNESTYTSAQLITALTLLMHSYQPTEIRTQANFVSSVFPDHSDHMAVGHFTQLAYHQYETQQFANEVTVPLKFYIGYPIHQMPENVSGEDLSEKEAAFLAYAKFDGGVCHSLQECSQTSTYNAYLGRQYQNQE